jgi:hypothetical protein
LVGTRPELRVTLDRIDPGVLGLLERHGEVLDVRDCTVRLAVCDLEAGAAVAEGVVRAGYRLYGLVPSHQSLEDLFLSLVSETSDR